MPRPEKSSHRTNRKNLVIITLMLAAFTTLITLVNIFGSGQPLILPELHAEKEALRQDPSRNSYYDIVEAYRDLPGPPLSKLAPDPCSPGQQMEFDPTTGSIPNLFRVDRPLDDEYTQGYIETTRYLIPLLEKAFEKEGYAAPLNSHMRNIPLWRSTFGARYLVQLYVAHAFVEVRQNDNPERGFEMLISVYEFMNRLAKQSNQVASRPLYQGIHFAYHDSEDPVLRQQLADFVLSLPTPYSEWDRHLENSLGAIDETILSAKGYDEEIQLSVRINLYRLRQLAGTIRAHRDHLHEVANAHPLEWSTLLDESRLLKGGAPSAIEQEAFSILLTMLHRLHWENTRHAAMPVVFAIEDHYRANGAYPESLDELVPAYLDTIPISQYTRKPYELVRRRFYIELTEDYSVLPRSSNDLYNNYGGPYAVFGIEPEL